MSSSKAALAVAALLGSSITACDGFVASAGLPTAARPAAVSLRPPLTHLKCSGLEAEMDGQVASFARRDALGLAAGALLSLSSQPAWAYDFRTVPDGACSYAVPSQWEEGKGLTSKTFKDPVSGQVVDDISVTVVKGDKEVASIKDLGKIEYIKMSKQLGLDKALDTYDMINAARRKGKNGGLYYDFDLASAPKTCSRETEMVSGTCPYDQVVLLSAWASGSDIKVLQIKATAKQWKVNGPLLKSLRQSFIAA